MRAVPVSVWRRTPQPCFPSRRGRSASRPHRSAIARLRSGAVASRSAPLRGGRSAAGAFSATVGTGARALPRGGHSAPACPFGVGCAPHPPMSGIRLGRNTSRRRLPSLSGDARIPPPVRAPAPFPPCVRWRAIGTCPFLRCASAHLTVSKVTSCPLIARGIFLSSISWIYPIWAILIGRDNGTPYANVTLFLP